MSKCASIMVVISYLPQDVLFVHLAECVII